MYIFAPNLKNIYEMTKEIRNKICTPGAVLGCHDLTAEEKKRLYQTMTGFGASESWTYDRFFKEGFCQWELDGIVTTKIDYLHLLYTGEKVEIEHRNVGGERYRTFYSADGQERSFDLNVAGDFWRFLGDMKRKSHFAEFMATRGMRSAMTVTKRFSEDRWKEYERVGIARVLQQMEEVQHGTQAEAGA